MATANKRVLITGANKGVGLATVLRALACDPSTLVYLGSRSLERGEAAVDQIATRFPQAGARERVEVLVLDVTSEASVAAAAARVAEQGPAPLYGIVNNAGVGQADAGPARMLDVNTRGPKRVCDGFIPLIEAGGRVVNVASASGPNFVAACSPERQAQLTNPDITWAQIDALLNEWLALAEGDGDFAAAGFGDSAYGLSKACLNAYTLLLAREQPELLVNACTPGFIETDMTRPFAASRDTTPEEMGMKSPDHGAKTPTYLLLAPEVESSGWYYGSDRKRSPMDRYRSPGDPPYTGD